MLGKVKNSLKKLAAFVAATVGVSLVMSLFSKNEESSELTEAKINHLSVDNPNHANLPGFIPLVDAAQYKFKAKGFERGITDRDLGRYLKMSGIEVRTDELRDLFQKEVENIQKGKPPKWFANGFAIDATLHYCEEYVNGIFGEKNFQQDLVSSIENGVQEFDLQKSMEFFPEQLMALYKQHPWLLHADFDVVKQAVQFFIDKNKKEVSGAIKKGLEDADIPSNSPEDPAVTNFQNQEPEAQRE